MPWAIICCALAEAVPASPAPGLSSIGEGVLVGAAITAAPDTAW
nr:hypothetical protein CPGR_05169 [Mycolicibacter nonchromogenicus]